MATQSGTAEVGLVSGCGTFCTTGCAKWIAIGLDQFGEAPQVQYCLSQALRCKSGEIFLNILGRVFEAGPMPLGCGANDVGCQLELIVQEVVGMPGFDSIGLQCRFRKILQIVRHDEVGTCADGRGQNVSIIRVWQRDGMDEHFVAGNNAIPDMSVHQIAGSLKLLQRQIRTVFKNTSHPFFVDRIRPFGAVQVGDREMHEQVAQRSRIEDARVIQNGEVTQFNSPYRASGPEPSIRPAPSIGCDPSPLCTLLNP